MFFEQKDKSAWLKFLHVAIKYIVAFQLDSKVMTLEQARKTFKRLDPDNVYQLCNSAEDLNLEWQLRSAPQCQTYLEFAGKPLMQWICTTFEHDNDLGLLLQCGRSNMLTCLDNLYHTQTPRLPI